MMLEQLKEVVPSDNSRVSGDNMLRLVDESEVSVAVIQRRQELLERFRLLPDKVFRRLRHFQPQSGCLNRCSFCSQSAASRIVEFSVDQIRDIIAAIRAVVIEKRAYQDDLCRGTQEGGSKTSGISSEPLIANDRSDRPGVVYLYLDNDPALFSELDALVRLLFDNLGVKSRIATVGYSRHNNAIDRGFSRLSEDLEHCIAGLRLSISPYTFGWTDKAIAAGISTKQEFEDDISHFLALFRKFFETPALGRKGACVEIRFRPLVMTASVSEDWIDNHLVIRAGNYTYLSINPYPNLSVARINEANDHALTLNRPGIPVVKIEGDESNWERLAKEYLANNIQKGELSILHKLENDDGYYYGIDVERLSTGESYAKYIYPKTSSRPGSGYIDGERYFLNALLHVEKKSGKISWIDSEKVIKILARKAEGLKAKHPESASYILDDVVPLISGYRRALQKAKYRPDSFFDKNMTVDTGHICNLGNAYHEYKNIASRRDLPMTPNHERAFGSDGDLAQEGTVYRLAPGNKVRASSTGRRRTTDTTDFIIEELDLASTASEDGQSKNVYLMPIDEMSYRRLRDSETPIIIGQLPKGTR